MTAEPEAPLRASVRQAHREVRLLFVVSCFINLLALTTSIYMLQVFDRVLTSRSFETLLYLTLIAVVALGVFALLEVARKRSLARTGHWFEAVASPVVLAAATEDRMNGRRPVAEVKDVADIRQFLAGEAITAFFDGPWLPVFIVVLFLLHPWLGSIGLLAAVALFVCAITNDLATRRASGDVREASADVENAARELQANGDLLRSMGMTGAAFARWQTRVRNRVPTVLSMLDATADITGLSRFIRLTVQIMILGTGAYLVLDQQLTSGGMIAASIILGRALAPVERSIQGWRGYREARQAFRNLRGLIQRPAPAQRTQLPVPAGRLEVETARYTPPGLTRPVLRNVTFSLAPGEIMGVIGPSGAGKSTLCRLLVGVATPDFGHVQLDGANLAEYIDQLGPHIGYVPQEVAFLEGTVGENIARFGSADPARLVAATRRVGAHEMILSLPDGYETDLGAVGMRLSGGQRQRLALARAFHGEPRFLVLDEPNSNLDGEGLEALVEALRAAKADGTTIVIVAHQPQIMRVCDRMLVLSEGMVASIGPRDEVMAKFLNRGVPAAGTGSAAVSVS